MWLARAERRWARAALRVGRLTLSGGGALACKGLNDLRQADLAPRETLRVLEEDGRWLKERAG